MPLFPGQVAQSVERAAENRKVGGSIPSLPTTSGQHWSPPASAPPGGAGLGFRHSSAIVLGDGCYRSPAFTRACDKWEGRHPWFGVWLDCLANGVPLPRRRQRPGGGSEFSVL